MLLVCNSTTVSLPLCRMEITQFPVLHEVITIGLFYDLRTDNKTFSENITLYDQKVTGLGHTPTVQRSITRKNRHKR